MDRRLFLTGLIGFAGATTLAGAAQATQALSPLDADGILDELDAAEPQELGDDAGAEIQPANHRRRHRRRRVWRRECRRVRRHGRWITRCRRVRVWTWVWI